MTDLKTSIIHESLRLFSLKGFMSTSITDILSATNSSKGGFYNHFKTKEELFFSVLEEAQQIWREKVLFGLRDIESPIATLQQLLSNYKDRYLLDSDNFPGGCVFITFSVELDDQLPQLCDVVHSGFDGLKRLLNRLLDDAKDRGELRSEQSTTAITELLFAGMIGASVNFGVDKNSESLDKSIGALIDYLESISIKPVN